MKIKPHNFFNRAIKLKQFDEEMYMFLINNSLLCGIYIGLFIALIIIAIIRPNN